MRSASGPQVQLPRARSGLHAAPQGPAQSADSRHRTWVQSPSPKRAAQPSRTRFRRQRAPPGWALPRTNLVPTKAAAERPKGLPFLRHLSPTNHDPGHGKPNSTLPDEARERPPKSNSRGQGPASMWTPRSRAISRFSASDLGAITLAKAGNSPVSYSTSAVASAPCLGPAAHQSVPTKAAVQPRFSESLDQSVEFKNGDPLARKSGELSMRGSTLRRRFGRNSSRIIPGNQAAPSPPGDSIHTPSWMKR